MDPTHGDVLIRLRVVLAEMTPSASVHVPPVIQHSGAPRAASTATQEPFERISREASAPPGIVH
jgi:hypothetical protein